MRARMVVRVRSYECRALQQCARFVEDGCHGQISIRWVLQCPVALCRRYEPWLRKRPVASRRARASALPDKCKHGRDYEKCPIGARAAVVAQAFRAMAWMRRMDKCRKWILRQPPGGVDVRCFLSCARRSISSCSLCPVAEVYINSEP